MYAIVRVCGKQYRVEEGGELLVERIPDLEPGATVELKDVLLLGQDKDVQIGQPTLEAKVQCKCLEQGRAKKVRTYKYRRSGNYARTYGHRQYYTRLLIERVGA